MVQFKQVKFLKDWARIIKNEEREKVRIKMKVFELSHVKMIG